MSRKVNTIGYFWIILFIMIFTAYFLQSQLFLEGDVGFLIHAAKELAAGGSYSKNFFETNPPMILYLYMPIVWITNLTNVNDYIIARMYVVVLFAISLFLSDMCLRKYLDQQPVVRYGLLMTMIVVLLFLPANQFAQREHIMMILTMPYWFLLTVRIACVSPVKIFYAVVIGLLAALGFALKPFFLIPLVLVELCFIISSRNIFSWLRIESVMICILLPLYLLSIFLFQRDYIEVILPLVSSYYFIASKESWSVIFSRPGAVYCIVSIVATAFIASCYKNKSLAYVLWFSLVGFTLAFIVPRSSWYYHMLPAIGMACLLFALLLGELAQQQSATADTFFRKVGGGLILLLASLVFFISPLYVAYLIYSIPIRHIHNANQNNLIQFVKFYAEHPKIYCIPSHHECTMLSEYAGAVYSSDFPSFWELRGLVAAKSTKEVSRDLLRQVLSDESDFIKQVADNVAHAEPDLVLIGTEAKIGAIYSSQGYIDYFSQNSTFRDQWRHYQLVKKLPNIAIYARNRS